MARDLGFGALTIGVCAAFGVLLVVSPTLAFVAVLGGPAALAFAYGFGLLLARPAALLIPVTLFSLVIARGYVLFDNSAMLRLAGAGVLAGAALIAWTGRARGAVRIGPAVVLGGFVGLLAIELVRGGRNGNFGSTQSAATDIVLYTSVALLAVGLMRGAAPKERETRLAAIALAPAVFIGVGLLLLPVFGPGGDSVAINTPSSLLGNAADRVQLPIAQSINNVGVVAAAGMTSGALLAMFVPRFRRVGLVAAVVCLLGVMFSDTRTALVVALLVIALFRLRPRAGWAPWVAVAIPASPFVMVWIVRRLEGLGLTDILSRQGGGGDLATASNRFIIWDKAIGVIETSASTAAHGFTTLFGYGAGGQIESGAAARYAYLFGERDDPFQHAHNIAIQTMLDMGLLGVAALVTVALVGIAGLRALMRLLPASPAVAVLGMLLVLLAGGFTEVVPTYYSAEALMLVLMAAGVAVVRPFDESRRVP